MTETDYSLALSDIEIERYRMMARIAHETESAEWARAGIAEGAVVADVGCGPGLLLLELAAVVGPTGRVAGVDREADAVATAQALIAAAGVAHAAAQRGDAWATGLEAGSFDVVNIRHVLAHNQPDDVDAILRHALELLRPGGAIFLLDVVLTGMRMDPEVPAIRELEDRYVDYLRDTGRDPAIGPKLGSLVRAAGFVDVERLASVTMPPTASLATIRPPAWAARDAMIASGHATAADVERWEAAFAQFQPRVIELGAQIFAPFYTVIARCPA